jgi:hypothetical protein
MRMKIKMPEEWPRCGILAGFCSERGKIMSRKEAILLASRTLAVLFIVSALIEGSYLPERLHSFLRYVNQEPASSTTIQYWRHFYLISLGFLIIRLVGFSLMALWLRKGGAEIEDLLLPHTSEEDATRN